MSTDRDRRLNGPLLGRQGRIFASERDRAGLGRAGHTMAVLGPTNTGKTHFAIERMLGHRSGMIGLPLRLLAREVYDKIVQLKGAADVALITGEERIVPAHPRFFVCTVEAMPVDIPVAFLAVDEIQLCADPERGHVFTDRLLHARGQDETMWLGAATMRGAIQRIAPQTVFVGRPRFSDLAYTGPRKLTRLPRRSAIVAFSAEDVYGIADLIRAQRGGAAVVMGALSPRTRNAQVALYQSGEVDFLVASDAIGMGINMDVDHVAFAAMTKFDGVTLRPLRPEEVGQIAGRAGRYMNDGTFGTTGDVEPLDDGLVSQVENHRYDPVRMLQWRSSALDFSTLENLLHSLDAPPPARGLVRARPSSDLWTLRMLAGHDDIRDIACAPSAIRRLWDVCQLPDFRKLTSDEHAILAGRIYRYLMSAEGVLPEDWLHRQIAHLDVISGDVDTLSARLAQIRTWTYAAHRPGWTRDPTHWQAQTRAVEDRLSDALHERLTQRFIDRRTAALMRHLRDEEHLDLRLDESGAVTLGAEHVGKLEGFRFAPDRRAEGIHGRTLRAAALKGLESEISTRANALARCLDTSITLSEHGRLWWNGAVVGVLRAGAHPLDPTVDLAADDLLAGASRENVHHRLETWTQAHIVRLLQPLAALRAAADTRGSPEKALPGVARGIAFQLAENFGTLDRVALTLPPDLGPAESALKSYGVRFGRRSLYLPLLLKPAAAALLGLLWAVYARMEPAPSPPQPGLTSFVDEESWPAGFLAACGFRALGKRAVRLDMIERAESLLGQAARAKRDADAAQRDLTALFGCSREEGAALAASLGYRRVSSPKAVPSAADVWVRAKTRFSPKARRKTAVPVDRQSPFASLAALIPVD